MKKERVLHLLRYVVTVEKRHLGEFTLLIPPFCPFVPITRRSKSMEESKMNSLMQKIAKLQAKAESAKDIGNLAEAEAFATKVTSLMDEYKLTMTDIEFSVYVKDDPVDEQVIPGIFFGQGINKRRQGWIEQLAMAIAKANSCKIYVRDKSNAITFVGKSSDRHMAIYAFCVLASKLDTISRTELEEAKGRGEDTPRVWRQSWLKGAVFGIGQKLKKEKEEKYAGMSSSTSLVRLDQGMKEVEDWWKKQRKFRRAANLGGRVSDSAYDAGKAHGSSMGFNKGISGSGSSPKQLG